MKVKPDYSITHFFLNRNDYNSNDSLKNVLSSRQQELIKRMLSELEHSEDELINK